MSDHKYEPLPQEDCEDSTKPHRKKAVPPKDGAGFGREVLRKVPIPLSEKIVKSRYLRSQEVKNEQPESIRKSKQIFTYVTMLIQFPLKALWATFRSWNLWNNHLKEISGRFGNGVASYFTFLRWLLAINIYVSLVTILFLVIPYLSFEPWDCMEATPDDEIHFKTFANITSDRSKIIAEKMYSNRFCNISDKRDIGKELQSNSAITNILDFFQGTGWMNGTILFYGVYPNAFLHGVWDWPYNLPLAYFLVGIGYLLMSLYLIISSALKVFEENYLRKSNEYSDTFSNKIFGSYDMNITDERSAFLASLNIKNDIEANLEEHKRLASVVSRSQWQKCKLYFLRVVVNLLILILLICGGITIYWSTRLTLENTKKASSRLFDDILYAVKTYASPVTLTTINFVFPNIFYWLSGLETWNPRMKIRVDLLRTVLLKLASVSVLMISLYKQVVYEDAPCWENMVGAEIYKLIWTDFFVILGTSLFVEYPRGFIAKHVSCGCDLGDRIGKAEFSIPKNVLELVYGQTLIWIGTSFSPLMPVLGVIKMVLVFYIKKISLMINFKPPKEPYRADRSNYFFMILLLSSFSVSLVSTTYAVTRAQPSSEHGPFRGFRRIYDVIAMTISTLPYTMQDIYEMVVSPIVIICLVVLLIILLYFYFAMSHVHERKVRDLETLLYMEMKEKRNLMRHVVATSNKSRSILTADENAEAVMMHIQDKIDQEK